MTSFRSLPTLAMSAFLLATPPALASHEFRAGSLTVSHPWSRASMTPSQAGAVYLSIDNRGRADRLLGAATSSAARAMFHRTLVDSSVARMVPTDAIDVPADGTVALEPGGLHIMLMGLAAPLAAGDRFPLTLRFEHAGDLDVEVEVYAVGKPPLPAGDSGS